MPKRIILPELDDGMVSFVQQLQQIFYERDVARKVPEPDRCNTEGRAIVRALAEMDEEYIKRVLERK